jgi:hypothetical protein
VRVINNSSYDAAAVLTIDGLNSFTFSENKEYKHYIVRPRSALVIRGWHRSNEVSDSFQVTSYAKSAVAQAMPNSSDIGMISVLFSAAWTGEPPPGEPLPKMTLGGSFDSATGRGARVRQQFQEVRLKTGVPRAAVTLRYNKPAAEPSPTPTPTPGTINEVVINAPSVQIMSGRQTVGTASQGEQFVMEQTQGEWVHVSRPAALLTERGWVHRRDVNLQTPFNAQEPDSLTISAAKTRAMSGPTVVATLSKDERFKILRSNGDWFEISVPKDQYPVSGWVRQSDIRQVTASASQ